MAGSLEYVTDVVLSGGGATTFDLFTVFDSTYDKYVVDLSEIVATSGGNDLWLRYYISGSVNTASNYSMAAIAYDGTGSNVDTNSGAIDHLTVGSIESAAGLATDGTITFYNPSSTSKYMSCRYEVGHPRVNRMLARLGFGFTDDSTAAVTGFQLLNGGGLNMTGKVTVYGVAKTGGAGGAAITFNAAWEYDDTTAKADPTPGKLRFNSVTPASITEMYIDDLDKAGIPMGDNWISSLQTDTLFRMGQTDDDTAAVLFTVDGTPVDETGYWTVPCSHVSDGTSGLTDGKTYAFQFEGGGSGGGDTFRTPVVKSASFVLSVTEAVQYLYVDAGGFTVDITIPLKSTEDLVNTTYIIKQVGNTIGDLVNIKTANASMTFNDVTGSIQTKTLVGDQSTVVLAWAADDEWYLTGDY